MAVRKTGRAERVAARKSVRRDAPEVHLRWWSALAGGLLIGAALVWFGWLALGQHSPGLTFRFPYLGSQSQPTAQPTVDPLVAVGISLSTPAPSQVALLTQQQALLLAGQLEPQAAAHAGKVSASYVLFSYKGSKTTTAAVHGVPAWLVHYTNVASAGPDSAADPHATNTTHDCYLFLDANSGQELLALWV